MQPPRAATHVISTAEVIEVTDANENLTATFVSTTHCDGVPSAEKAEWSVIRLARMGQGDRSA